MAEMPNTFRRARRVLVGGATAFVLALPFTARASDFDARLDQYALDLGVAKPLDSVAYFRSIDADLRAAGTGTPGMDMATLAGDLLLFRSATSRIFESRYEATCIIYPESASPRIG